MDAVGGGWAGDLECSDCRRKRLTASNFSRKNLEQHRKLGDAHRLRCKDCVAAAMVEERKAPAVVAKGTEEESKSALLTCSRCKNELPASSFTNTQATKVTRGEGGKCRDCTLAVEVQERTELEARNSQKIVSAQNQTKRVEGQRGRGSAFAHLQAAAAESAAEAELVTGLKPMVLGRGSGRGRGRGR